MQKDKKFQERIRAKGYASTILTENLSGGLGAGIGPGQEFKKTLLGQ